MKTNFTRLALAGLLSIYMGSTASAQCLITTGPTNNCSYGDAIDILTINGNTVSNSGCSSPSGYTAYTTPTWNFTLGSSYPLTASLGGGTYNQGLAIWIDLNANGQYESTEQVYASTSAGLTQTGTVTIPAAGTPGLTVMRVMCAYNTSIPAADACTSNQGGYGETEDYPVMLSSAVLTDDIEVTSIIKPVDATCGSATDSLIVRVTNVGTNPTSTFQLDAVLSGMLTGSYSATVVNPIPAATSVDVFLTTLDTQAGGALTINATATYSADLNATNNTLNTTVNLMDATPLVITGPSSVCSGDNVQLTVNTTTGVESTQWYMDGVLYDTSYMTMTGVMTADAQFVATSSNTCRAADTLDILVIPTPTASFTSVVSGGLVDFTGTATDYDTIVWDFGDGNTGNGLTPSNTYAANGSYYVCMSAINACDTATFCDTVYVTTLSVGEYALAEVSVYPNPSSGLVNISLAHLEGLNGTWFLVDMDGKMLESGEVKVQSEKDVLTISLEPYPHGSYIFRIEGSAGEEFKVNLVRN